MTHHPTAIVATDRLSAVVSAAMTPLSAASLGGDPKEVMSGVVHSLQYYAKSGLVRDLSAIRENIAWLEAVAGQSYRHANGFSKLVLADSECGRLRLHIWEPGSAAEENIHEHRWHFASAVLAGSIESEVWVDALDRRAATFEEFIYEVREGKATRWAVGRTRAMCTRKASKHAGDGYFMLPGVMHRITRTNGVTATLVCTTMPSRSWNRMLSREGVEPNVDKRPLQATEVKRLIDLLLGQLVGGSHVHRN
jgi:hypothetical protein